MSVKFGNPRKPWIHFPLPSDVQRAINKPADPSAIVLAKKMVAILCAVTDVGVQRVVRRVTSEGEAPFDPVAALASEIRKLLEDQTKNRDLYQLQMDHSNDRLTLELVYRRDAQPLTLTSCSLDMDDVATLLSTCLCALSRTYGREYIRPYLSADATSYFPSPTDMVGIAESKDSPYDILQDFGSVLLSDDQNQDSSRKEWIYHSFAVVEDSPEYPLTKPLIRKDRD